MEQTDFLSVVKKKQVSLFFTASLVAAASFLFLILTQEAYKVRTDFIITQNNPNSQDFYAMSRSTEYIGKILSEAIYSERFIDAVVETGNVPATSLPFDKKAKLEQWSKTVSVTKNLELGMISVMTYNDNQREALKTSQAISDVLIQKNNLFRGGDEKSVEVRVLSGPIVERNPSVTQLILVVLGGFLFGGLLGVVRIFVKTEMIPAKPQEITLFQ
jgi:uncharacterized protein involved in exopolysaccharide biosynthesis